MTRLLLLGFMLLLPTADTQQPVPAASDAASFQLDALPSRRADAISGGEFARRTIGVADSERQAAAVAEILRGNVPEFQRRFVPIRLDRELSPGRTVEAVAWVSPDYLAIGNEDDFLRMPLSHGSATTVAGRLGCVLPTTRIVDAVFEQSAHHLRPNPLPPGPKMRSSEYYLRHRALIEHQLLGVPLGGLISGHKKDVVLTIRLASRADRVAIYGWHRPDGEPIQPLSTFHGARYADYSHGLRLVRNVLLVDGRPRSIYEVLADPYLAPLVSDEGRICSAWKIMHPDGKKTRPKDLAACP